MGIRTISRCVKIGDVDLTIKEANFVDAYIKNGGNATKALQEIDKRYQEKSKEHACRTLAFEILAKPVVRQALGYKLEQLALNKEYVASKFYDLSNDKDSREIQLRATKELGHIVGLYQDAKEKAGNSINILFNMPASSDMPRIEVQEVKSDDKT